MSACKEMPSKTKIIHFRRPNVEGNIYYISSKLMVLVHLVYIKMVYVIIIIIVTVIFRVD
jgi:hypothetical protein